MKSVIKKTSLILLVTGAHLTVSAGLQGKNAEKATGVAPANISIGKVVFSSQEITGKEVGNSAFLTSYGLGVKSPFFISTFIKAPLVQFLNELAPESTTEDLVKEGCLQFSFYVDKHLVYTDDLHPLSLTPEEKSSALIIQAPLKALPKVNHWGEYLWDRFRKNGGDSALTDGKHQLRIEIRPYIKNSQLKLGRVIAEGSVMLDVKLRQKINPENIKLNAISSYSGLEVSEDHFDKTKIQELKAKELEDEFKNLSSIVVLKNGKILIEEYFNNADRNTLHDVRSVGKSFASTVMGIAITENFLKSENQTLNEFYDLKKFANYSDHKANVNLKDLLTMSSVFQGDDNSRQSPGREDNMYPSADWVKFTLDLPVDTAYLKGEWHYFTAGVVLLGDVLDKTVPKGLEKYADEKLFKPLNITNYKWQYTPQKVASTAGGIRMNSLDFAKYAQLYKNEGTWKGKQLLSKNWVNKTLSKHKALPRRENEHYGYLFWNRTYKVDGKNYEAFYCAGNGGNHLYIFKDVPLVAVVTATAYNTGYAHSQVQKIMEEYILKAVFE